jgi:hypothetical protein
VAKYPRMSAVLDKAEYTTYNNQRVMLNGRVVKVSLTSRSNRYGSWATGFKFTNTLFGYLTRRGYKKYPYNNRRAKWWQNMMLRSTGRVPVGRFVNEYSADHGKTWHTDRDTAFKCRGKVVIRRETRTELAFEGIQQLCRREDPNYQWRP